MLLYKPLKIKRPSPIRLTRSSRRKRAFGLIFWISDYRRCCCYGVCDVAVEQEKREQPYPDGFPNMAVFFCCIPVWQLPCVSIISILFYWKLPDEDFFFIRRKVVVCRFAPTYARTPSPKEYRVITISEQLPRGMSISPPKRRVFVKPCRAVNARAKCV